MPSMPQSSVLSQASSDPDEVVVRVDTYKDVHVAAVLTALAVLRETKTFPATTAGYNALLAWVGTFGMLRRAGVECAGSYGAALARSLRAAGASPPWSTASRVGLCLPFGPHTAAISASISCSPVPTASASNPSRMSAAISCSATLTVSGEHQWCSSARIEHFTLVAIGHGWSPSRRCHLAVAPHLPPDGLRARDRYLDPYDSRDNLLPSHVSIFHHESRLLSAEASTLAMRDALVMEDRMTRVSIVGPDEGEVLLLGPTRMRILEDGSTTGHRLGLAESVIAPHTDGPKQHRHAQHDEGFYVVSGTVRFTVGDTSYDAPAGTLVMVPTGAPHTFTNVTDEPTVLLSTFTPDLYVQYFRDLRDVIESGQPMTDQALAEVMARYATVPFSEYALQQDNDR